MSQFLSFSLHVSVALEAAQTTAEWNSKRRTLQVEHMMLLQVFACESPLCLFVDMCECDLAMCVVCDVCVCIIVFQCVVGAQCNHSSNLSARSPCVGDIKVLISTVTQHQCHCEDTNDTAAKSTHHVCVCVCV